MVGDMPVIDRSKQRPPSEPRARVRVAVFVALAVTMQIARNWLMLRAGEPYSANPLTAWTAMITNTRVA